MAVPEVVLVSRLELGVVSERPGAAHLLASNAESYPQSGPRRFHRDLGRPPVEWNRGAWFHRSNLQRQVVPKQFKERFQKIPPETARYPSSRLGCGLMQCATEGASGQAVRSTVQPMATPTLRPQTHRC